MMLLGNALAQADAGREGPNNLWRPRHNRLPLPVLKRPLRQPGTSNSPSTTSVLNAQDAERQNSVMRSDMNLGTNLHKEGTVDRPAIVLQR